MTEFAQLTVNGLGRGAVYALLALGFVIIFKATEVVNFAHGSLVLVGGYLVYVTRDELGYAGAIVVGLAAAGLGALLIERLLISRAKLADPIALVLLTIGIDVIITEEIVRRLGTQAPFLGGGLINGAPVDLGPVVVFRPQLIALIVGLVLITAFFLAFRYTGWGVAMRARAENREAAALMGIRSSWVTASAWALAGILAGVAVLFIATQGFSGVGLTRGTHAIALAAFPAAIIGGLDSTGGAVVGGLVIGLTETLSGGYIGFDFATVAIYIVMLIVLVIRPAGLFGTRELSRV